MSKLRHNIPIALANPNSNGFAVILPDKVGKEMLVPNQAQGKTSVQRQGQNIVFLDMSKV